MGMNILCIGGGPAGLYFALLMKQQHPSHQITVVERNRPYDTFGWGVVFSDQTLDNLRVADPATAKLIGDAFNHWDDIEVFFKGRSVRSTGHGFCGIGRKHLLNILQQRCEELGVQLVFETEVTDDQVLAQQYQADLGGSYTVTGGVNVDTSKSTTGLIGAGKLITFDPITIGSQTTTLPTLRWTNIVPGFDSVI